MKKQKKQAILNAIIVILVLILITLIGSIIYEERINMKKQQIKNTDLPSTENDNIISEEQAPINEETTKEEITTVPTKEPTQKKEEYVGEEEKNSSQEDTKTNDDKAIEFVKKECGNDNNFTFSIEKKKGTKYYVAVKSSNTETVWYEVDTETWEVNEY